MHNLLEVYMREMAGHLAGLPAARRAEELREMRTHLENLVLVEREQGRTEDEAARAAVAQFGAAQDLGENVVWAWRREQTLNKRCFWGAVLCTVAVIFLVDFLVVWPFIVPYLTHTYNQLLSKAQLGLFRWVYLSSLLISPTVAGLVTAAVFPRKAVSGALLGVSVYVCYCWGRLAFYCATDARSSHLNTLFFVGEALQNVEAVSAILFVAWAVSRLRMARQRRRHQAAAK